MENQELTGNTILFKNDELFDNVTDISSKEYRKNSISIKRTSFNLFLGILFALLVIGVFITAFFVPEDTIKAVLIIISSVTFAVAIFISMFLIFKKSHLTSTVAGLNKLVVKFYEYSFQSSVFKNDSQVSIYNVTYNDVTKVIIKNHYITIFNKVVQPLTLDLNGFNVPEAKEQLLKKFEEYKAEIILK